MKKTLIYIILLGALGGAVWYFFFNSNTIFSGKDAGFTIRDTGSIGKIFLATKNGESVKLERAANGWRVDGKYNARPASIDQLLQTLNAQAAQAPVSEAMHNNIVKALATGHVKVEIYDRNGGTMRIFYVGGETKSGNGTFMQMEGGSRPYVVQIPGFTGYLTPRYMPETANWRDRTVFDISADNITKISMRYGMEPLNSFTILKNGNDVKVQIDPALMEGKELNTRRANGYPKFFEKLYAEQIASNIGGVREEISKMPLRCSVAVEGKNNYHQDVDMYFMPISRRSKNLDKDRTDTTSYYDADRMYAVMNNKQDTMIVQIQMFSRLFRRGYEFYMHEEQPQQAAGLNGVK